VLIRKLVRGEVKIVIEQVEATVEADSSTETAFDASRFEI
jgi:hypothetical protein